MNRRIHCTYASTVRGLNRLNRITSRHCSRNRNFGFGKNRPKGASDSPG
jgi:hypothetical protein